jgi:hypothetical protein
MDGGRQVFLSGTYDWEILVMVGGGGLYSLTLLFKGRLRQLVHQYCCSQIQEMGKNSIMSFMTSAANQTLEATMKEI